MPSGMENVFLIVTMGEFLVGKVGNGFIVLVNCIDWGKGRKLSSVDHLLSSLALSRISLLWVMLFESIALVLWPHLYTSNKITAFISTSWALNNHFSIWIATCLSVFYFLRIANLSHPSFHWLRQRISRVLAVLLLGSSLLLSVNFALVDTFIDFWTNWHRTHQGNSSWPSGLTITLYVNSLVAYNLIYLIPLLLSLGSLVLLFVSLKRHTRNLQMSASCSDASTEAHRRAMQMVMSFLALFLVHLATTILVGWAFFMPFKYQAQLAFSVTMNLFPAGHSLILIRSHSKLRQTALWLLGHLECSLRRKTGRNLFFTALWQNFLSLRRIKLTRQ
nr:unnamed protein product [Sorex araneus]